MTVSSTTELHDLQRAELPATQHNLHGTTDGPKSIFENNDSFLTQPSAPNEELGISPLTNAASDAAAATKPISKLRLAGIIGQPSMVNFFSSFTSGIITVALPVMAQALDIPRSLYLWPSSVYGLTSGSMLLIAGAIADLIGPRRVELAGIILLGFFTLASGLCTTGVQLVIFRALQGIAMAMHLPASVALVAAGVPEGRARNFGFACLGLSQPLGFSVGLVASGIMVDKAGWRSPFYLSTAGLLVSAGVAFWALPNVKPQNRDNMSIWKTLYTKVDWLGGVLASGGLALLAYVLAVLSADLSTIRSAETISMLTISVVLLISFPCWMHYREKAGKTALVPNSLWKNMPFTSTCIMVALSYGVMNAMELFSSLYFQEIQHKSTLTTSLYLLPSLMVGVFLNFTIGLFVHRLPARWIVTVSSLLCAAAPLIMALVNPAWNYWLLEFWAQIFAPMSADVLFTVGLIIVSESFPQDTQALAGAVFNTVGQFGQSLGMGVCQVVALGVIGKGDGQESSGGGHGGGISAGAEKDDLLKGYRASFWTMFAYMLVCGLTAVIGLRKAGKVGVKRD